MQFSTSKGDFTIKVHRDWAPHAADHFRELVEAGFYNGCRFFRVVPNYVAQFGMHWNPEVQQIVEDNPIWDDPPKISNTKGLIAFAHDESRNNSRMSQVFINLRDNQQIDRRGFVPFGEVLSGMYVVESLNSDYGNHPVQAYIRRDGERYLQRYFARLDWIKGAQGCSEQVIEKNRLPECFGEVVPRSGFFIVISRGGVFMPSRKEIFEFEKERIEMLGIDAANRRGNEPFVVIVLDLLDDFGYQIACAMSSPDETDRHIDAKTEQGAYPTAMLDTTEHDAGVFFENSGSWPVFMSTNIPPDAIRVAIVGEGGVTFCSHRFPG